MPEDMTSSLTSPVTAEERTAAAQAAVRSHCGWHVAPILTTAVERYEIAGDALLVPTMRLLRVVSITTVDGRDLLAEDGSRIWAHVSGIIYRRGGWAGLEEPLAIDIEHGYTADEAPDVITIVKQAAARAEGPASTPDSERAGPFQRGWGGAGPRAGISLLNVERDKLDSYVLNWGP